MINLHDFSSRGVLAEEYRHPYVPLMRYILIALLVVAAVTVGILSSCNPAQPSVSAQTSVRADSDTVRRRVSVRHQVGGTVDCDVRHWSLFRRRKLGNPDSLKATMNNARPDTTWRQRCWNSP